MVYPEGQRRSFRNCVFIELLVTRLPAQHRGLLVTLEAIRFGHETNRKRVNNPAPMHSPGWPRLNRSFLCLSRVMTKCHIA
jgi:hypothetical protein